MANVGGAGSLVALIVVFYNSLALYSLFDFSFMFRWENRPFGNSKNYSASITNENEGVQRYIV